ncbi:MAG: flagellar export chaperone FliS [Armatimonadota bacterium]|jgi:flagellar protein FliS
MDFTLDDAGHSESAAISPRDGGSLALRSYQQSQVLTASREQLVVLTYDGILRFLGRACRGLETGDYYEKHLGLARAQALIIDLARSLDRTASPELAGNLFAIYARWLDELVTADADDDQPRIAAVMALVADLREAWAEVARRAATDSLALRLGP